MAASRQLNDPKVNPDPYDAFVVAAKAIKQRNAGAHNARQAKEEEMARGSASSRTRAVRLTEGDTIVFARGSLADTAYFFMQPIFSADLACREQGITEPRQIARIILRNLAFLDSLTRTRTKDFPYVAPTYDHTTYKVPNAGTFERMLEKAQGPGHMQLQDDGTLIIPDMEEVMSGDCPARYATKPAEWSHREFEEFHTDISERYDVPPEVFTLQTTTVAKRGFTLGALVAEQTFLGKSHELSQS